MAIPEIVIILVVWLGIFSFIYVLFKNRKAHNQEIPIALQVILFMFSFVPLGIIMGTYLAFRKKKINDLLDYKYSERVRICGKIIMVLSIISTLFIHLNLT